MPIKSGRVRSPTKTVILHGTKKGGITGIRYDMTRAMNAALPFVSFEATRAMAKGMDREMLRVFRTKGDGSWEDNADLTVEIKGHGKVMVGRTREALRSISDGRMVQKGARPTASGAELLYGWPDDPHPDTGGSLRFADGQVQVAPPTTSSRAIQGNEATVAAIMTLHEFGYTAKVPNARGPGFHEVEVKPRRWLTLAADSGGQIVLLDAVRDVDESMETFFVVGSARTQGGMRTIPGVLRK